MCRMGLAVHGGKKRAVALQHRTARPMNTNYIMLESQFSPVKSERSAGHAPAAPFRYASTYAK